MERERSEELNKKLKYSEDLFEFLSKLLGKQVKQVKQEQANIKKGKKLAPWFDRQK